jgi:hypothetical protein
MEQQMELEVAQANYDAAMRGQRAADIAANEAAAKVRVARDALEEAKMCAAAKIPVDRSARTLTDGSPVTDDHRETTASGQQKGYVVLSEAERAKGFVRPVRHSYKHLKCGGITTMGQALAETYARDPYFYSGTFCCDCRDHFPVGEDGEFVWSGTEIKVGT